MTENEFSITPEEFVNEFKGLKEYIVEGYFSEKSDISRIKTLTEAGLNKKQISLVKSTLNESLTDALYTILLALEGSASINQHQIMYKLQDEAGNELTGELDTLAYEAFHEQNT